MKQELSRQQFRLLVASIFAFGALAALLLTSKWPTLFPPKVAEHPHPAQLTSDEKRHIVQELSQSTSADASREETKAALQALSAKTHEQSLTHQAKLDVLTSLNQP